MSNDWVSMASLLFAGFGVFGVFGLFACVLQGRSYYQVELLDPLYRQEIIERLRDASRGVQYRSALERALAWLNKLFGEPGSSQALGLCILVAMAYAYATFFLGWSLSGSGSIAGFEFLPNDWAQSKRFFLTSFSVLCPVLAYFAASVSARFANRWERRFKTVLLRLWHGLGLRRLWFDIGYRAISGLLVLALIWFLLKTFDVAGADIIALLVISLLLLGGIVGKTVARRVKNHILASLLAFFLSGIVITFALAGPGAVAKTALVAVGAVAEAGAMAVFLTSFLTIAMASFLATSRHRTQTRGVWAGALGGLVGLGLFVAFNGDEFTSNYFALFLLLFFFILPLANGLFDWLSWWATRALGKRLLNLLSSAQTGWQRWSRIALHGLADLAIAVILLLLMAYTLAFGFAAYNQIGQLQQHIDVFHLRETIRQAADAPWREGFWLTTMLLTTLLPTFGHGVMLLGSPLGLMIPGSQRLQLALTLESYDTAIDRQAQIRRKIAYWIAYGQWMSHAAGLLLLLWLLGRIAMIVIAVKQGGIASFAGGAAELGIQTAEWLGRLITARSD